MKYTWKIQETDNDAGTMVVQYTYEGKSTSLNIPMPTTNDDFLEHLSKFAPSHKWMKPPSLMNIEAGTHGDAVVLEVPSEEPNVAGSWNEEYLRAMIYQVLEEIRESEV